jgi:3-oxoacyl-[acyl-carrier protein] reductase
MLSDRVVIVTGGSRGIGRACVLQAVALGARVIFCCRHDGPESRAVEAEAAATGATGCAVGVAADVSDEAAVARLFVAARERFGRVDAVVNNAAISRERLLVSLATEDWDAVIGANLTGAFLVAREALRTFHAQGGGGRVVAIGTLSQYGVAGNASYAASKGGLLGLTRLLARQYARRGIESNMVVAGYVETAMSAQLSAAARRALIEGAPLRRAAKATEIANVVAVLLSDQAAGVDGRVIFASGGLREVPP